MRNHLRQSEGTPLRLLLPLSALAPFAVFFVVTALYLLSSPATPWHNDVFQYAHTSDVWIRSGIFPSPLPERPAWIALLGTVYRLHGVAGGDVLTLLRDTQTVSIIFTAAASAMLYIIARKLFASEGFASFAAILFAANPVVWYWGQSGMTDLPTLALMLGSFLCFLRFLEYSRASDLVFAGLLVGAASLIRLPAIIILGPYAVGLAFHCFRKPETRLREKAKTFLGWGTLLVAVSVLLPLIVYGTAGPMSGARPHLLQMTPAELFGTLKFYVMRGVGWPWFLLAAAGFGFGLAKRETRATAFILLSGIAVAILYIAEWYDWTASDTGRYIILSTPMTVLTLGFLWKRGGAYRMGLSLLAFVQVLAVVIGLARPLETRLDEPRTVRKVLLFPYLFASTQSGVSRNGAHLVADHRAVGTALPEDLTLILSPSEWARGPLFFDIHDDGPRRIVWVGDSGTDWHEALEASKGSMNVFLGAEPARMLRFDLVLEDLGFVRAGDLDVGTLFVRRAPGGRTLE